MYYANIVFNIPEIKYIIDEYAYEPKQFIVFENSIETIDDYLNIGNRYDTIYYCTNNQLGCVKYEIEELTMINNKKEKYLRTIWTAEDEY